jgi:hypothetical protein
MRVAVFNIQADIVFDGFNFVCIVNILQNIFR